MACNKKTIIKSTIKSIWIKQPLYKHEKVTMYQILGSERQFGVLAKTELEGLEFKSSLNE